MKSVNKFHVGPMLGHTTNNSFHVFGRGLFDEEQDSYSVLRYRKVGEQNWSQPMIRRQKRHFDSTSITIVTGLDADSHYEYQAGFFTNNNANVSNFNWHNVETHQAKTSSDDVQKPLNLVFGSCRYVLKLFGWNIFDDRSDKTFRSIYRDHEDQAIDRVLMLGDQIYADDMNAVAADDTLKEYLDRYRSVFGEEHFSRLMANVPVSMTLDDHEIEDNWPSSASPKDRVTKYPNAMYAYNIYQMSHSGLAQVDDSGKFIDGFPGHFWYTFSDGCCQFFMMDVRTERDEDEIISHEQMDALQAFLKEGKEQGRINVVCTSVPFFPDYNKNNDDKWSGFISQRNELLDFIESQQIEKVVFLAGDVHASMACTIEKDNTKIHSVVSSPFYWPMPHPNKRTFQLTGQLKGNEDYTVTNKVKQINDDNYTQLKIDHNGIDVTVKSRKGDLLSSGLVRF